MGRALCETQHLATGIVGSRKELDPTYGLALRNALADEAIRKRIVDDGATPRPDPPEDYAAAIEQDRALWGGIVKKLGLRVE